MGKWDDQEPLVEEHQEKSDKMEESSNEETQMDTNLSNEVMSKQESNEVGNKQEVISSRPTEQQDHSDPKATLMIGVEAPAHTPIKEEMKILSTTHEGTDTSIRSEVLSPPKTSITNITMTDDRSPKPSPLLLNYRIIRYQLQNSSISTIPIILPCEQLRWIVMMLKDNRTQDPMWYFIIKLLQEKIAKYLAVSSTATNFNLLTDPDVTFTLQILQLSFHDSLELFQFNEKLWEIYLPLLALQTSVLNAEHLTAISTKNLVDASVEKYSTVVGGSKINVDLFKLKMKAFFEYIRKL